MPMQLDSWRLGNPLLEATGNKSESSVSGLRLWGVVTEIEGGFRVLLLWEYRLLLFSFLPLGQDLPLENALSLEKLEGVRRQTIARLSDECSQFTKHCPSVTAPALPPSSTTWTLSPTSPPHLLSLLDLRLSFLQGPFSPCCLGQNC